MKFLFQGLKHKEFGNVCFTSDEKWLEGQSGLCKVSSLCFDRGWQGLSYLQWTTVVIVRALLLQLRFTSLIRSVRSWGFSGSWPLDHFRNWKCFTWRLSFLWKRSGSELKQCHDEAADLLAADASPCRGGWSWCGWWKPPRFLCLLPPPQSPRRFCLRPSRCSPVTQRWQNQKMCVKCY